MTSLSTTNTTEQHRVAEPFSTEEIRGAITLLVDLPRSEQQKALARIIAGAIANTEHTAMQRFATTGAFDTEALLHELEQIEVPFEQEAWVDALARFVLFTSGGRT